MEIKKRCGIYCIENIINHKKYFGLARDINKRFLQHKLKLRKNKHDNPHLQSAFNQYGIENFIFYAVEICDEKDLNDKEIYYIELYKTTDREYGYNILTGGGGTKGREVTQETRQKISKIHKGTTRSKEFCDNLSKMRKGVPRYISPEQREKMVASTIGKKMHYKNKKSTSEYKGVCWKEKDKRWAVNFRGKGYGYFFEEKDAALFFDKICWEDQHDKNKLNFPEIDYDYFVPKSPLSNKFIKRKGASSKYLGVCFLNIKKKWTAIIRYENDPFCLGEFKYEIEAALAYNNAAMELYGYKAVLNDIPQDDIDNLWKLE